MSPEAKNNREAFEAFLRDKLPVGSDVAKYSRGLDAKVKAFYKKRMQRENASIYESKDENAIYQIKQDIVAHPGLVYQRSRSGDARIEGLDLYISFIRRASKTNSAGLHRGRRIERSSPESEGKHIKQETTVIQRNPLARRKCIEYYGCRCAACGLAMNEKYGQIGEGVIEVHHLNPIHLFDDTHPVDYKTDLIPLCPNCHTIIHKLANPGDLDGLKIIVEKNKQ